MLSRVAENLYWMARYLERADDTARLINGTTHLLLDLPRGASFGWDILPEVVGLEREFRELYVLADEASIVRFLILDDRNPSSIVSCIRNAREDCRTLREVLPPTAWERINSLYLFVSAHAGAALGRTQRYNFLNEVIERRQAIIGFLSCCVSHDVSFQFIRLGRNLERADMTTRIVDITSAVLLRHQRVDEDPSLNLLWMGVLKSLDAYQMYRRHVAVDVAGPAVVDFLIKDPQFPRAVRYSLREVERCLSTMPHNAVLLRLLAAAQARIQAMQPEALSAAMRHRYLDALQSDLVGLDQEIARQYFLWDESKLRVPETT
jgi:uncharacterized alpha-E superfamily protein